MGLASFNGWSLVVCGALCFPVALFDPSNLLIGACLLGIGAVELHGRRRLGTFDPSAASLLGYNQVALLVVVWLYCGVGLYQSTSEVDPISAALATNPDLAMLADQMNVSGVATGELGSLFNQVMVAMYVGFALVTLIFQGACAYFYFNRRGELVALQSRTPAWVLELIEND